MAEGHSHLKDKTANTIKWNLIDRLASQVLYAVVGIVLANVVNAEDFGLVGALIVFQSFAIIFSDSGLGAALLQNKTTDNKDYSTVFWFNLLVSVAIYWILWFCAPLIADIFQGDRRLIPLSKVMFLTFVLNAMAIVQTNRLMREMNVRMIAISNIGGQIIGGCLGIGLALAGYGAWALVWQSVALAAVRTGVLWLTGSWIPALTMSAQSFKKIWRIGLSVFSSSILNTLFLTVYSFVIGAFYSLRQLGIYTQADKWSKMGSSSLSQIFTASFVPLLAKVQSDPVNFKRYVTRINRFTSFLVFPFLCGLAVIGEPLFHTLFGNKWDTAIPLFQILCVRGIAVVFVSLCGNYMLALGYGKRLFSIEIIKDLCIVAAILATVWFKSVELLVWGQLWASLLTIAIVGLMTLKAVGYSLKKLFNDLLPFAMASLLMCIGCWLIGKIDIHPVLLLISEIAAGSLIYVSVMKFNGSPELPEAFDYLFSRFRKNKISGPLS